MNHSKSVQLFLALGLVAGATGQSVSAMTSTSDPSFPVIQAKTAPTSTESVSQANFNATATIEKISSKKESGEGGEGGEGGEDGDKKPSPKPSTKPSPKPSNKPSPKPSNKPSPKPSPKPSK